MKSNIILIIIAVVVALVVVVAGWFLYIYQQNAFENTYDNLQAQPQSQQKEADDNTTEEISNNLNQIPDDSSINSEIDSLNADVQSF